MWCRVCLLEMRHGFFTGIVGDFLALSTDSFLGSVLATAEDTEDMSLVILFGVNLGFLATWR